MSKYEGFDPLSLTSSSDDEYQRLINESKKRQVRNILESYTGYFDLFAELIQNSLDACEKIWRDDPSYLSHISIHLNLSENSFTVSDNGTGMNKDEFEFCLAPNISFKTDQDFRGKKGVGATFLAYGFNNIKIHTKTADFDEKVILLNGHNWVDDKSGDIERPKFGLLENNINHFLSNYDTGSTFKVTLSKGEKPNLKYLSAYTADQWLDILKIKTPLGGIYLTTTEDGQFKPKIDLKVTNFDGSTSQIDQKGADYFYPHEIPNLRVKSIDNIEDALKRISGSPQEKSQNLPDDFKRLNAVWEIWNWKEILEGKDKINSSFKDEEIDLIKEHKVSVYGFFGNSTRIFDRFNNDYLEIRKGYRILRGGLQMASDGMPQGELITIPLTRYIGYQEQTHVIVHFYNGNPDLGRKTFQKEKQELGEKISKNVVDALKKYRAHMKADETGDPLTPDREKHEWIREQETYYSSSPVIYPQEISVSSILSKPQKEQDVVALFHEFVGNKFINGLQFYATSEHRRYDSVFRLNYQNPEIYYSDENSFGVSKDVVIELPFESEPKILEYKYDFDALVRECLSGEKYHKHIDFVVAWNASLKNLDKVELKSLLVQDRGRYSRKIYGSTHLAYLAGHYDQPIYEVLILEDLLNYLVDPENELANQITRYSDI